MGQSVRYCPGKGGRDAVVRFGSGLSLIPILVIPGAILPLKSPMKRLIEHTG